MFIKWIPEWEVTVFVSTNIETFLNANVTFIFTKKVCENYVRDAKAYEENRIFANCKPPTLFHPVNFPEQFANIGAQSKSDPNALSIILIKLNTDYENWGKRITRPTVVGNLYFCQITTLNGECESGKGEAFWRLKMLLEEC